MSKTISRFTKAVLDGILADCKTAAPPDTFSKSGAVKYLAAGLRQLRKKGYSPEAIQAFLKERGLEVSGATIKQCLGKVSKTQTKVKTEAKNEAREGVSVANKTTTTKYSNSTTNSVSNARRRFET